MADEPDGRSRRESWGLPFLAGAVAVLLGELFQRFVWDLEEVLANLSSSQFWPLMAVLAVCVAALFLVMRRTQPPGGWRGRLLFAVVLVVLVVVLFPSTNALVDRI